jgi:hypothetical protein
VDLAARLGSKKDINNEIDLLLRNFYDLNQEYEKVKSCTNANANNNNNGDNIATSASKALSDNSHRNAHSQEEGKDSAISSSSSSSSSASDSSTPRSKNQTIPVASSSTPTSSSSSSSSSSQKLFLQNIFHYITKNQSDVESIKNNKIIFNTKINELIEYFGEDVESNDIMNVFSVLSEFRRAVVVSKDAVIRKIKIAQRTALQKK